MRNTSSLIMKYFLIWLVLSTCYFFFSEKITKLIAPGFDSVQIWFFVVSIGLGLIFIITTVAFFIAFLKRK
jgi:hypothetical protein